MKPIDLAAVGNIIAEVAATEIMPRFRNLGAGDVEVKGDKSSVTVADKAAEQALIVRLQNYLPHSIIVGEESFEADNRILLRLSGNADVWVIDPIDGTRNFIEGRPEFGVIVALVRRKQTVAAWIHDPSTGDMLRAEQGSGVWLNGYKMRLASSEKDVSPLGLLSWHVHQKFLQLKAAGAALPESECASAASFDYPRFFTGDVLFANSQKPRVSFFLGDHAKPWDHAAGLLMIKEVQGYGANLFGHPYDPASSQNKGLLSAPNRPAWDGIHQTFKAVIDPIITS